MRFVHISVWILFSAMALNVSPTQAVEVKKGEVKKGFDQNFRMYLAILSKDKGEFDKVIQDESGSIDFSFVYPDGSTALFAATRVAIEGETYFLERLLDEPLVLVNQVDQTGNTAFFYAIRAENADQLVDLFLKKREPNIFPNHALDIDFVNKEGVSALVLSVREKKEEVFNKILAQSPDLGLSGYLAARIAYETNQAGVLQVLAELGYYANHQKDESFKLVEKRDFSNLKKFVKTASSNDLKALDSRGNTLLTNLIGMLGDSSFKKDQEAITEIIFELIRRKASLDSRSRYGEIALLSAVRNKNIEIVKALISAKVNLDLKDEFGKTAVHKAVEDRNIEILKTLISAGANLDLQDEFGKTAVHEAVGNIEILKTLISAGANLDLKDDSGWTALMLTVLFSDIYKKESIEILKALISAKANLDLKDKYGNTAVHEAVEKGNIEILKVLISAGANLDLKDEYGKNAVHRAVEKGNIEILKALINSKANLDLQDNDGDSPLILAALFGGEKKYNETLKALVDAHVNLNLQNRFGETALIMAANYGNVEVLKTLIDAHANLNLKNKTGDTALIRAVDAKRTEVVKALIRAKANLDLQNENGETALIKADKKEYSSLVDLLVDSGADVCLADQDGYRALTWFSRTVFHGCSI